jgi:hypothetical protein
LVEPCETRNLGPLTGDSKHGKLNFGQRFGQLRSAGRPRLVAPFSLSVYNIGREHRPSHHHPVGGDR